MAQHAASCQVAQAAAIVLLDSCQQHHPPVSKVLRITRVMILMSASLNITYVQV